MRRTKRPPKTRGRWVAILSDNYRETIIAFRFRSKSAARGWIRQTQRKNPGTTGRVERFRKRRFVAVSDTYTEGQMMRLTWNEISIVRARIVQ